MYSRKGNRAAQLARGSIRYGRRSECGWEVEAGAVGPERSVASTVEENRTFVGNLPAEGLQIIARCSIEGDVCLIEVDAIVTLGTQEGAGSVGPAFADDDTQEDERLSG